MNNFEKYTFIKEKLNAPRFDNEDEEIDWFTKHLYGLYNQASRLREENNNYIARIDKQKKVLDKTKEYVENLLKEEFEITDPDNINYGEKCQRAYFSDSELIKILELLEEIE